MTKRQRAHRENHINSLIKKACRPYQNRWNRYWYDWCKKPQINFEADWGIHYKYDEEPYIETYVGNANEPIPEWVKENFNNDAAIMSQGIEKGTGLTISGLWCPLAKWVKLPGFRYSKVGKAARIRFVQADGTPLKLGQQYDQVVGGAEVLLPLKRGWVVWDQNYNSAFIINKKGKVKMNQDIFNVHE